MTPLKRFVVALTLSIPAFAVAVAPASAQFYKGKRIQALINSNPGGNTDVQGRLFMRHIVKFIPGKPRYVVRNLGGGGGGIIAVNYMGEVAKRDGYTVNVNIVSFISEVLEDPGLRVKFTDLIFIGGLGMSGVLHIRKDATDPKIEKAADIFRIKKKIKAAGYRATNGVDIHIRMTLDMLGVPYKLVSGFRNSNAMRKAYLQGEVSAMFGSTSSYFGRTEKLMVATGKSIPLWHTGLPTPDGSLKDSPNFKNIPNFLTVYKQKFGKDAKPSGALWDAYLLLTRLRVGILRGMFMPPGSPKEAVAIMRKAWDDMAASKAFLDQYKKINGGAVPIVTNAADGDAFMKNAVRANPKVVAFIKDYIAKARR